MQDLAPTAHLIGNVGVDGLLITYLNSVYEKKIGLKSCTSLEALVRSGRLVRHLPATPMGVVNQVFGFLVENGYIFDRIKAHRDDGHELFQFSFIILVYYLAATVPVRLRETWTLGLDDLDLVFNDLETRP